MRKVLVLLGLVLLVMVPWGGVARAADDFVVLPASLTYKFEEPGVLVKQLEVHNQSGEPLVFTANAEQYRNFTQEEIDSGKMYADPAWVSIQPETLSLPAGTTGYLNVAVSVEENVSDGLYQTYVRITDGEENSRVTVNIEVGAAVGYHNYGISPGYYELLATGTSERISKELSISVVNTGTADGVYKIYSRMPDSPEDIDSEYEVGDLEWVQVLDPEISVAAGQTGTAMFQVVVPGSVPDGKYKMWVGVMDTTQDSSVQVEYACKLLMTVETEDPFPWWVVGAVGGGIVALILLGLFLRRRRGVERQEA